MRLVRGALAVVLDVVSAVALVLPYIAVVEMARSMLAEPTDPAAAWRWVWIAVAALLVRIGALFAAMVVTHLADAELAASLRARIVQRLGVQVGRHEELLAVEGPYRAFWTTRTRAQGWVLAPGTPPVAPDDAAHHEAGTRV